nr:hypothetical protein [Propionicimonas sp.]
MKRLLSTLATAALLAGCGPTPTSEVKGDNTGEETTVAQTNEAPPSDEASPTSEAPAAEDVITATFKVTATGKASVSWGTGSGMSQDEIKKGAWSKKVKLDDFDIATLTVTSSDYLRSQTVTCQILINGVSKAKNKSKGKLAFANCSTNTTK